MPDLPDTESTPDAPVDPFANVPAVFKPALVARGFTSLTAVQQGVLEPKVAGRDLRISSQTGSGKTVAVGMMLAEPLGQPSTGAKRPRVLLITPTRELAMQVAEELAWLLKDLKARVVSVTGGTSVSGEVRSLSRGADVVVGTPGRLVDHLTSKALDPAGITTVVLDEADQMLDLGFRDELDTILTALPTPRRTHMVSATFSRPVLELARRYQPDAVQVQGTVLGASNADITHVVHVVFPQQRLDALVNLLLLAPDELTLVFVRTRAEAGDLAEQLTGLGFSCAGLSGEMEQAARTRVMTAFRMGTIRTLVATDVAARGIDVQDITRVIHLEAPKDPDVYTHRSGRTGRAGRKGQSIVIVPPAARARLSLLLKRAGIRAQVEPVPDAAAITAASDARLLAELTTAKAPPADGQWEPHLHQLATTLLEQVDAHTLVHRLLSHLGHQGPAKPRSLTKLDGPTPRGGAPMGGEVGGDAPREARPPQERRAGPWVRFAITTGSRFNMDPRRLLATICRRGNITGRDVGAIVVGDKNSMFDVHGTVADAFAAAAAKPDARDPLVRFELMGERAAAERSTFRKEAARPDREHAPREHAPREHAPREHAPREHAPREHAPREHAPREHAPREHAPRDHAPREHAPREHAPREQTSRTERAAMRSEAPAPAAAPRRMEAEAPRPAPRAAPTPPPPAPPPRAPRAVDPPPAPKPTPPPAAPSPREGAKRPPREDTRRPVEIFHKKPETDFRKRKDHDFRKTPPPAAERGPPQDKPYAKGPSNGGNKRPHAPVGKPYGKPGDKPRDKPYSKPAGDGGFKRPYAPAGKPFGKGPSDGGNKRPYAPPAGKGGPGKPKGGGMGGSKPPKRHG